MPYLDWKDLPIRADMTPHARYQTQLALSLSKKEAEELAAHLEDVYLHSGTELRMGLPANWVLFWKAREEGSRTLLAHPQAEEWVGTIALDQTFSEKLLFSLKNLEEGQSLILSQLGLLGSVSNLELLITVE